MNSKLIIITINIIYLFSTILWFVVEKSMESFVSIIGGLVSLTSFYIGNEKSFSVKIGRQINMGDKSTYNENN